MSIINKIFVSGNIAREVELKQINERLTAARLVIALNVYAKQINGEEKEERCFVECTLWNDEARKAAKFLKKGSRITVEGRLKMERWNDKNTGMERVKHVIAPDNVIYDQIAPQLTPQIERDAPKNQPQQTNYKNEEDLPF